MSNYRKQQTGSRGMSSGGMAIAVAAAVLGAAGCAVPGVGSADPSGVAAHQSVVAASQAAASAAAADAAKTSACASWTTGNSARVLATRAVVDFTKNPSWDWDTVAPLLNAEVAAITTESNSLTTVISTAQPNPGVHTALVDYKAKLETYKTALRTDQTARGEEDATWRTANPAGDALGVSTTAIRQACAP